MENPLGDVSVANAATSDAGENGNAVDSPASVELSDVANQESVADASSLQEQSTTQETKPEETDATERDEPKDIKQVRDWGKSLERDIKQKFQPAYAGLEKAATELYGTNTPEDIQATISTVQALAPTLKVLTDPNATQADVVNTLTKMLPSEHMEGLAWAALNDPATQAVIFDDPEVLKAISDRLFDGQSIEDVLTKLASVPETEVDPEQSAWRQEQKQFRDEQARIKSESAQKAAQEQSTQLMTRFFETPAQRVIAEDFKLVAPEGATEADKQLFSDTAKDIRFAAQGRFLEENMDAYMQIDALYKAGKGMQAQAAEIRLANRYQATLIKTAERHANLLKSRSAATVNGQQAKINGVRPDVAGSVEQGEKKEERWDIDAPDFAQKFAASFHN